MGSLLSYGKKIDRWYWCVSFSLEIWKANYLGRCHIGVCAISLFTVSYCKMYENICCVVQKRQIEVNWIGGRTCNLGFYCHKKMRNRFAVNLTERVNALGWLLNVTLGSYHHGIEYNLLHSMLFSSVWTELFTKLFVYSILFLGNYKETIDK